VGGWSGFGKVLKFLEKIFMSGSHVFLVSRYISLHEPLGTHTG
jgi:hypothetical protein